MRTSLSSLRAALFLLISTYTSPLPLSSEEQTHTELLFNRAVCANGTTSCGYNSQLCCAADQVCYTDSNNQAQCTSTTTAAAVQTAIAAAIIATTTSTLICNGNAGQSACGSVCCNAGSTCLSPGVCGGTSITTMEGEMGVPSKCTIVRTVE